MCAGISDYHSAENGSLEKRRAGIETHVAAIAPVPILVTAFVILYLFPDDTKRLFA